MKQTSKDSVWTDETGMSIPYSRTTPLERKKETTAYRILSKAKALNEKLGDFKKEVAELCNEVYLKAVEELNTSGEGKGNFTFYNFDRSIKVEVSVSERIDFDDLTINACKEKLDEFITANVESKTEFVRELVNDAFTTQRGKLDAKKVMSLLKYRSKIRQKTFQEALDLLEQSIRRPSSKTYFRVWERDGQGEYKNVDLNFSSIQI